MADDDPGELVQRLWRAIGHAEWDVAAELLHDDFVQEWPQSGERIVGRDDALAVNREFPGGPPRMTVRRALSAGELGVMETELAYADGSRFRGVSIVEVREGRIVRETDYFGEPFPAPQWRARWVQRM